MELKNHHRKAKTGINEMKWQKPSQKGNDRDLWEKTNKKPSQKGKSPPSSFPLHSLTSTTDLTNVWWNQ